jgi:5,5'-dehydrodivanillate O-demethylase
MLAWQAQGALTDRSKEHLGRTDRAIVFLRKQLDEQISQVEQGADPMNVFRDDAGMGEMLHGADEPPDQWLSRDLQGRGSGPSTVAFRAQYHKGFVSDDADRYGPVADLVQELHRRVEVTMAAGR